MMDRWKCTFNQLITEHTFGQLVILGAGSVLLDKYTNEEVDRRTNNRSNRTDSKAPSGQDSRVPMSKLKAMSTEEYDAYIRGSLGQSIG